MKGKAGSEWNVRNFLKFNFLLAKNKKEEKSEVKNRKQNLEQ